MNSEIRLRKLEEKDIPGMLEWMHDPDAYRWFRFNAEEMTPERVRNFIANSFTETARHYAITDETDEYLGTISIEDIDRENSRAMIAYSLRSCARGKGIIYTAIEKVFGIVFDELKLERFYVNVLADNIRSKRSLQKAGFVYEGCFRRHMKLRGEWHDLEWYAILKDEYYARNNRG